MLFLSKSINPNYQIKQIRVVDKSKIIFILFSAHILNDDACQKMREKENYHHHQHQHDKPKANIE